MAYIEAGEGDPILFIHGNPTSSYMWREIMPYAVPYGRVIAVDLIGMGRSGKPEVGYSFADHSRYLDEFINQLGLKNVTLVVHDWGSALGFDYARRHPDNIKGLVFMEALIPPVMPAGDFSIIAPDGGLFVEIRKPGVGEKLLLEENFMIEKGLAEAMAVKPPTEEEMQVFREPYPTPETRRPILEWARSVPVAGQPADVAARITAYGKWLRKTELPKLYFHADPGAVNPPFVADFVRRNFPNTELHDLGEGRHFLPKSYPREVGSRLAAWLQMRSSEEKRSTSDGDNK